ncbi:hypothetical protein LINPERHAP1_LOCUS13073, partial [Linum perenne]
YYRQQIRPHLHLHCATISITEGFINLPTRCLVTHNEYLEVGRKSYFPFSTLQSLSPMCSNDGICAPKVLQWW